MARLAALPQFWLAVFVLAGLVMGRIAPFPLPHAVQIAGLVLTGVGIALMIWAAAVMARARTTVLPGQVPAQLVTHGPFRLSRNPIYLGDVAVLGGFLLAMDAPAGLTLVPFFIWLLHDRFIRQEEAIIAAQFGPAFDDWQRRVRRWI